ncbi:hypothetical protein [uncultured Clostridium sp.]|uniref:hypothetical protein n=1 Tax=uncultured Clostridium sp. TaxID=59620 RepID=UPI0028E80B52|nr:hypothetical protein [uncultured Clostridium sp.]
MNNEFEVLVTANEYIDNLKNGANKVTDYIEVGNEQEGIGLIPLIADGVEWLLNAIDLTKNIHKGTIDTIKISEKLCEIVEALENEDYILVGDLFKYEILDILEEIQNNIKKVIAN